MVDYLMFVEALTKEPQEIMANLGERHVGFLHAAMGISGEAGELLDAVKKHVIYNKELDVDNAVEELGDIMFYVAMFCNELGLTMNDIIQVNRDKLNRRYNQGQYTDAQAIARADKAA